MVRGNGTRLRPPPQPTEVETHGGREMGWDKFWPGASVFVIVVTVCVLVLHWAGVL